MNIQEQIKSIKEIMIEQIITNKIQFNDDKIKEFENMEFFINDQCTDNEKLIISQKLVLLSIQTVLDENPNYDEEYNQRFNNLDFKRLASNYFVMLKKDKEKTLSLDNDLLFLSVNCMRNVPCRMYNEFIAKLTYPSFVASIKPVGKTDTTRIIYNKLSENILSKNDIFDINNLDKDMFQFIMSDVYSRIGSPKMEDKTDQIKMDLLASKSGILKNISNASKVNTKIYEKYMDKVSALEVYDTIDIKTAQKYLEFEMITKEKYDNPFLETQLELTALAIINNIDILDYDMDELINLVNKMSQVPYSEYSEKLNNSKIK